MDKLQIRSTRKRRSRRRLSDIPRCIRPRIPGTDCENIPALPSPSIGVDTTTSFRSDTTAQDVASIADQGHSRVSNTNPDMDSPIAAQFVDEPGDSSECVTAMLSPVLDPLPASTAPSLLSGNMMNACEDHEGAVMSPDIRLKVSNWRVLWALLMTNGSKRLTKDAYQSVRTFVSSFSGFLVTSWKQESVLRASGDGAVATREMAPILPHYSTLHKTYKPRLLQSLAVRGEDSFQPVDLSKAGARSKSTNEDGDATISVRIILPSEYARADVSSPSVWPEMQSTSLSARNRNANSTPCPTDCVDALPIVAAREWFYGPKCAMNIDNPLTCEPFSSYAEVGDIVEIRAVQNFPMLEPLLRCFGISMQSERGSLFRGRVCHTWNVRHRKRVDDGSFAHEYMYEPTARDRKIATLLGFQEYTSPSDHVTVEIPDLPMEDDDIDANNSGINDFASRRRSRNNQSPERVAAVKRRRAAIREKKKQEAAAWQKWRKPMTKPGDFVTLLQPCSDSLPDGTLLTDTDRESRLCVVHRFWTEHEEKSRHVFWIPGGHSLDDIADSSTVEDDSLPGVWSPMCREPPIIYMDVQSTTMFNEHDGKRGPQKHSPVSSEGVLPNGELYFIYRFVLFWDGFQMQAGNQASCEGVYMLCLNLPLKSRSSPNAVRILSLTPPGAHVSVVLNKIFPDIIEGMTTGFLDFDAEGHKRRIFLDLIGCLGDTPALNSTLDVLGHTAAACCHLCRFSRASLSIVGSRYTTQMAHGRNAPYSRGFLEHAALHDCNSKRETCRLLGVRSDPSLERMPLHSLRLLRFQVRNQIPTTVDGLPLLPYQWDPYRACIVAPDHLLTGHLRDCITLAYRLLPSTAIRKSVEAHMVEFLVQSGLPDQNRLFDHEKKTLFSMSMTELYSLALVAELAFAKSLYPRPEPSVGYPRPRRKCTDAVSLVGSCASLITTIWRKPELKRDGHNATRAFRNKHGQTYIGLVQNEVDRHISKVRDVCTLPDADTLALEDDQTSSAQKAELLKLHRECLLAIRTIDKPNVHRLRELAYSTLPMFGHMSLVGELVLEKAHQSLKRAVHRSNNKDAHLTSMQSIAIDDWEGRLSSAVNGAQRDDDACLLHCFRLLAGREAVASLNGKLGEAQKQAVLLALGPGECIRTELEKQRKSVLSPRNVTNQSLSWSFIGRGQEAPITADPVFSTTIRDAFRSQLSGCRVWIGNEISSSLSNGIPGPKICRRDVVETLCCNPDEKSSHYPFLIQTNCSNYLGNLAESSAPSLWFVQDVLRIQSASGQSTYYLAVRPCVQKTARAAESKLNYDLQIYTAETKGQLSLARLDSSMRKVGVIRDSPSQCRASTIDVRNSSSFTFFALTREMGYPPRKG